MAHLRRAVATLRIRGNDLVPEEISLLLGATPTHSQFKGEVMVHRSGRTRIASFGQWRLEATDTEPENLDGQVKELLAQLSTDISIWKDLCCRFDIDLFCGWFMGSGNEGVSVSPSTLSALGERGIELALDIYGPDY